MSKEKVVGVKFDTRHNNKYEKTYYYKTDKEYEKGQSIKIRTPNGGQAKVKVVVKDSKANKSEAKKRMVEE